MYYGINNLIKNLEDFKLKFRTNINKVTECGILLLNSKIVSNTRCFDILLIITK